MEEIQTKKITVSLGGESIVCELKEKDHGDNIVYDVFADSNYLVTISKDGEVLFDQQEADDTAIRDQKRKDAVIKQIQEKIR